MDKSRLYRGIPKVDVLLADKRIQELEETYSRETLMEAIRTETDALRAFIGGCEEEEAAVRQTGLLVPHIAKRVQAINTPNMRKVINGTGTILHTNLGRAPISPEHMQRAARL